MPESNNLHDRIASSTCYHEQSRLSFIADKAEALAQWALGADSRTQVDHDTATELAEEIQDFVIERLDAIAEAQED